MTDQDFIKIASDISSHWHLKAEPKFLLQFARAIALRMVTRSENRLNLDALAVELAMTGPDQAIVDQAVYVLRKVKGAENFDEVHALLNEATRSPELPPLPKPYIEEAFPSYSADQMREYALLTLEVNKR